MPKNIRFCQVAAWGPPARLPQNYGFVRFCGGADFSAPRFFRKTSGFVRLPVSCVALQQVEAMDAGEPSVEECRKI